jgi:putative transposase
MTCGNGREFAGRVLEAWVIERGVQLIFICPGRPMENEFIACFSGRLQDECLNVEWFLSLEETQQTFAAWRHPYNHQQLQSALRDRTPPSVAAEHRCGEWRFASSNLDRALGVPPQGFAAPAGAALDPGAPQRNGRQPAKKAKHLSEVPGELEPLHLSLGRARIPYSMRPGGS